MMISNAVISSVNVRRLRNVSAIASPMHALVLSPNVPSQFSKAYRSIASLTRLTILIHNLIHESRNSTMKRVHTSTTYPRPQCHACSAM